MDKWPALRRIWPRGRALRVAAIVIGPPLAAFMVLAAITLFDGEDENLVELRQGGQLVAQTDVREAVAEVSSIVGFDVTVPSAVPERFHLAYVDSTSVAYQGSNDPRSVLGYGAVDGGDTTLTIAQSSHGLLGPQPLLEFEAGVDGIDVGWVPSEGRAQYWVDAGDRGFFISFWGSNPPEDDVIAALIRDLTS